ncbi:hypothetical protein [Marinococcus halotolerans]|uniref:hypothetical protein n=1 Tax=Marinococcus halotolerans TaxID=301092 RepID=UPI0003B4665D|nr:hypothetical protein [Marinococcus halotolerans]
MKRMLLLVTSLTFLLGACSGGYDEQYIYDEATRLIEDEIHESGYTLNQISGIEHTDIYAEEDGKTYSVSGKVWVQEPYGEFAYNYTFDMVDQGETWSTESEYY